MLAVAEPAHIGGGGNAIFIIAVDGDGRACAVRHAGDRAALVGHQEAAGAAVYAAAFIPHDRIVAARAMDIAAQEGRCAPAGPFAPAIISVG
jgi:hypothetical protein